jgi:hypothetical protein
VIKIAHRGNTNGPSDRENEPNYLLDAIAQGYEIEVDVWLVGGNLWLGHDYAQYQIDYTFLYKIADKSWFHCKNLEALEYFNDRLSSLNYFWHQEDNFTLTSNGYIWTYPGQPTTHKSVIVDLEAFDTSKYKKVPYAICTDYPNRLSSVSNGF